MITLIDIGILIVFIIYGLFSFLHHEWWHIKSQGLFMHGRINVYVLGMTAMPDNINNNKAYWYGGGIGSGIVHLIVGGCLVYYNAWGAYVPLISFGVIQTVRGIQEGLTYDKDKKQRYWIYAGSAICMICFWLCHYWLFLR